MTDKVGIIGVGHFASFLVEGLRSDNPDGEIILSPRSAQMSAVLARQYGCQVAGDNQQVADNADIVIICVRPDVFEAVVSKIKFTSAQMVISVAAGVTHKTICDCVAPAKAIRSLPISSAAINQSPTLLYPDDDQARNFLKRFGKVCVMDDEKQFAAASAYSALYGWGFRLLDEAANWGAQNGLSKDQSLVLMREVLGGVAAMAEKDADKPMEDIVESLKTEGGITELGLNVIDQRAGFEAWHHALDAVHKRMISDD